MEINLAVVWLIAALVLAGLEMASGTFYLLMLGLAALAGALAAWSGADWTVQLAAFCAAALVLCLVIYWMRRRADRTSGLDPVQNYDIGALVAVGGWRPDGTALVQYRGCQWTAQAAPGAPLAPGQWRVVRVSQNRLVVEPVSINEGAIK